jgi:hypothetical protein
MTRELELELDDEDVNREIHGSEDVDYQVHVHDIKIK